MTILGPDAIARITFERHADSWGAAVNRRHSRRRYQNLSCPAETVANLKTVCEQFQPYPDARAVMVEQPSVDVFRGLIGSYGRVSGAPHVLVIVADESSPRAHFHAGYTGEAAILHATVLGLNTCWVGGLFSRSDAAALIHLGENERVIAVSPVGLARERGLNDRLLHGIAQSRRRKPLEEIAPGIDETWPAWAQSAVEYAQLAPSAVNRQPWRFALHAGELALSAVPGLEAPLVTKALDCGIAALHAELGAAAEQATGIWHEVPEGPALARFVPSEGYCG